MTEKDIRRATLWGVAAGVAYCLICTLFYCFAMAGCSLPNLRLDHRVPSNPIVLLNFDGGEASLHVGGPPEDVPPSDIAHLVEPIRENLYQDFEDLANFTFVSTTDGTNPPRPDYTIFFGGMEGTALGIAQIWTGHSIVYEGLFLPFFVDDQEGLALALSNTASHELGHLVGFEHTGRWWDLMGPAPPMWALGTYNLEFVCDQPYTVGDPCQLGDPDVE